MTLDQAKLTHSLIAEDKWEEAANYVLKLLGKPQVGNKNAAIKVLQGLFQHLLDSDLYLQAATLQWGPDMFNTEPESTVRVFRALHEGSLILLMGSSSMSKTYAAGGFYLLDYLRDPLYTTVKLAAVNEDHLKKNLFAHVVTLFRACAIPCPYEITIQDSALWMGVKSAGNEFGISGIAFKQSQETSGQFKGYKAKPVRKKKHPSFGVMSRLRVLGDECVRGDQPISMADGRLVAISDLVSSKTVDKVVSLNPATGQLEAKAITGWHRVPRRGRGMLNIGGAVVTEDHPVFTQKWKFELANVADTCLKICHEDLQQFSPAIRNADGDLCWGSSGGFVNIAPQRGTGQCKNKIYAGCSATSISSMEAQNDGRLCNISDQGPQADGVRRADLHIFNTEPPGVHQNTQCNGPGWKKAIHERGDGFNDSGGTCGVVHGRRKHGEVEGNNNAYIGNLYVLAPAGGCATGNQLACSVGYSRQAVKEQGVLCNQDERQRNEGLSRDCQAVHCAVPSIQTWRHSSDCKTGSSSEYERTDNNMLRILPRAFYQEKTRTDLFSKVRQSTMDEAAEGLALSEEEPWVYCIDVEDNHNFFASGVCVHNCQNWPGGPFKDFNSLVASKTGSDLIKIACAFNPESTSVQVVQLAEPENGWSAEDLDKLYDWESKAGWRVCRLDAALSENVKQKKVIYPGLQTYEGFLSYLKAGGDNSANYWCVDQNTEALSKRGWVKHYDLGPGDQIYTVNPQTGLGEFAPLEGVYSKLVECKKMYLMTGRGFEALCTEDHRWGTTHKQRIKNGKMSLDIKHTTELKEHDLIPLIRPCGDFPGESKFSADFAEIVGWVISDGTFQPPTNGNKVCINQSATANPEKCERIRALLLRAGANHWEQEHNGIKFFNFSGQLAIDVRAAVTEEKRLTPEFILSLNKEASAALFEGLLLGDGGYQGFCDKRKVGTRYFSTAREGEARMFSMLAARLGYATTTHRRWDKTSKFMIQRGQTREGRWIFIVNLRKSQYTRIQNIKFESYSYDGVVWCPKTKNQTFLARRNGTTYLTGNCFARGFPPMVGTVNTIIPPAWPQSQRGEVTFTETPDNYAAIDLAFMGKDTAQMAIGRWGLASGWRDNNNVFHPFVDRLNPSKNKPHHVLQIDQIMPLQKTDDLASMSAEIMGKCKMMGILAENVAIDKTGIGFGTWSHLTKIWGEVFGVAWNEKPTERKIIAEDLEAADKQCDGVMSEMWWAFRKWLDPRCSAIFINPIIPTQPIHTQLTSRRYKHGKNGIKVEAKEEYMARSGGISPDEADSLVMLVHAVRKNADVTPGLEEQEQPGRGRLGSSGLKFESVGKMANVDVDDAIGATGSDEW